MTTDLGRQIRELTRGTTAEYDPAKYDDGTPADPGDEKPIRGFQ